MRAYQGAIEAVFAVIIGVGIGYWVDDRFGTTPWALLIGVVIGFAAMVLRLVRLGSELEVDTEAEPDASSPDGASRADAPNGVGDADETDDEDERDGPKPFGQF